MNILYCGNDKIAKGLLISILSLVGHCKEPLHIYVLTMEFESDEASYLPIPATLTDSLDALVKETNPESFVKRLDITGLFKASLPVENLQTRFTPYCMLRLFADKITELPDKLLYLDTDVVCRKDFSEFYRQDITEYEFAGVLDYYGRWFFHNSLLRMDYVNSGVLLLNMSKIRETGLFETCRRLCAEKRMFMPDQSALNKAATAKKLLPRKYNEQRKLQDDTIFQHFTTTFRFFPLFKIVTIKPWEVEKVHEKLKIYEYDVLFAEYARVQSELEI